VKVTKRFEAEDMELNMTPMIDVVFQLLIFFIVVSEVASYDRVADLTLPVADMARPEQVKPNRLIISVDRNNNIWVARRQLTLADVEQLLRFEKMHAARGGDKRTSQPVLIQADRNSEWRVVQDIIERAAELKFWQLAFSAKKSE
jgi:biopolymer transport protein ExbD